MSPEWHNKLATLIVSGSLQNHINDDSVDEAIILIRRGAIESPEFLLNETDVAVINGYSNMASLIIAMLFTHASSTFLSNNQNKYKIINIIVKLSALDVQEIIDMIKENRPGRRLGSRPQKLIRAAMEEWPIEKLRICSATQPKQLYNLLRLIHPRYKDRKANLIKTLIKYK